MAAAYDIGASGPSTSTSATSSTGPVNISFGKSMTDWTIVIVVGVVGVLALLFILKRKRR